MSSPKKPVMNVNHPKGNFLRHQGANFDAAGIPVGRGLVAEVRDAIDVAVERVASC